MPSRYESIENELNIETSIVRPETAEVEVLKSAEVDNRKTIDVKKDYEYTRANLYALIDKGQEAITGIMELAQESDSARAYEVAGQLIKSTADVADKLIDLQKKMGELTGPRIEPHSNNVTNNTVFVGSTTEVLNHILNSRKKNEES